LRRARVKGKVKAQVLVVKEGAHFEGGVIMTPEGRASSNAPHPAPAAAPGKNAPGAQPAQAAAASGGQGSIFNKEREAPPSGDRAAATGSGSGSSGNS
jgi:hypothetical protein